MEYKREYSTDKVAVLTKKGTAGRVSASKKHP